jgi:hypothetical protein
VDNCYYAVGAGTGTAMTATFTPAITVTAAGLQVFVVAPADCGFEPTFNAGDGAVDILHGTGLNLQPHDFVAGQVVHLVHDGTNWIMVGKDPYSPNQLLGSRDPAAGAGAAGHLYAAGTVGGAAAKTITINTDPAPPAAHVADEGRHLYFILSADLTGATSVSLIVDGGGAVECFQTNQSKLKAIDGKAGDIWHCVFGNGNWHKV